MTADRQPPEVLLAAYEERCALLADLGQVVQTAVKGLLDAKGLRVHSVVHRVKTKSSAERKLAQKGSEYTHLGDMHDLLGVRVITFFPDEVDRVAQVVTDEFEIDERTRSTSARRWIPIGSDTCRCTTSPAWAQPGVL